MVCDWWECRFRSDCNERLLFNGSKYPPCAVCVQFDSCSSCKNLKSCSELVVRYLPTMFRRLVRDIRIGEDTARIEKVINRSTCNGMKNPTKCKKS